MRIDLTDLREMRKRTFRHALAKSENVVEMVAVCYLRTERIVFEVTARNGKVVWLCESLPEAVAKYNELTA